MVYLDFKIESSCFRPFFRYNNLNDIPTNGIARYKKGNIEIEYGYYPLEVVKGQKELDLEENFQKNNLIFDHTSFNKQPAYIYEKEKYVRFNYHASDYKWFKIMPVIWTVDTENQMVTSKYKLIASCERRGNRRGLCLEDYKQNTKEIMLKNIKEVKLGDVNIDDFQFIQVVEKEDYSYDKSPLFKTRIDVTSNGRLYMRDLIKFSKEKLADMLDLDNMNKVLYWKNKSILPSQDNYIEIIKKSYKLYIDDQFITELTDIKDLCVSTFQVQYKDKNLYNYKNLTEVNYNDIYELVYDFIMKFPCLKSENNFKYMLNRQIDIRNNMLIKYRRIHSITYDTYAQSVHQRLQKKFIDSQIDIKEYNNYFEKMINIECENLNERGLKMDIIVSIKYKNFDIDICVDYRSEQTLFLSNGKLISSLSYPCVVNKIDDMHYQLSHDLGEVGYLEFVGRFVYLNGSMVAECATAEYNRYHSEQNSCSKEDLETESFQKSLSKLQKIEWIKLDKKEDNFG